MATVKFKYVGDPNDNYSGPETTEQQGYRFVKDEVTEISDDTEAGKKAIRVLKGHNHFVDMSDKDAVKADDDRHKQYEKAEADKEKAEEQARKDAEARYKSQRTSQVQQAKDANARRAQPTVPAGPTAQGERPTETLRTEAANPTVPTVQQQRVEERVAGEDKTKG